MFLRNFWEWLRMTTQYQYYEGGNQNWMPGIATSMTDISGNRPGYFICWRISYGWTPNTLYYTKFMEAAQRGLKVTSIRLGSGSRNPLMDDYDVDDPIVGLSNVTYSAIVGQSQTTGGLTMTVSCSATNTSSDPIVIRQIGLCHGFVIKNTDGCNRSDFNTDSTAQIKQCMIAKHLLAEPIEIPPGDTKGFTVMVEMS